MTKFRSRSSLPESSVSTGTDEEKGFVDKIRMSVLVTTEVVVVVEAVVVFKLVVVVELRIGCSFDYSGLRLNL